MGDDFLSQENTGLLWEVLLENPDVPRTETTRTTFATLLPRFYSNAQSVPGSTSNLVELNKQFISVILESVTHQVTSEPVVQRNPAITHDEIQNERKAEFDLEFEKAQQDFSSSMKVNAPETPSFSDNLKDEPISDMTSTIERIIAERNLEMNTIQTSHGAKKEQAEKWLAGKDTSIASEQAKGKEEAIKYIKIDDNELGLNVATINLDSLKLTPPAPPKGPPPSSFPDVVQGSDKQVTWGDNEVQNFTSPPDIEEGGPFDLFSKLKRKPKDRYEAASKEDMKRLFVYVEDRFNMLEKKLEILLTDRKEYLPELVSEESPDIES
jgi:hypothetical protein